MNLELTNHVKVNKPGSPLNQKTGVITGVSNLVIDPDAGTRFLLRFHDNPFTYGVEEKYLSRV